jgi:hypothetical protein
MSKRRNNYNQAPRIAENPQLQQVQAMPQEISGLPDQIADATRSEIAAMNQFKFSKIKLLEQDLETGEVIKTINELEQKLL